MLINSATELTFSVKEISADGRFPCKISDLVFYFGQEIPAGRAEFSYRDFKIRDLRFKGRQNISDMLDLLQRMKGRVRGQLDADIVRYALQAGNQSRSSLPAEVPSAG